MNILIVQFDPIFATMVQLLIESFLETNLPIPSLAT